MAMITAQNNPPSATSDCDNAKRQQILDGARRCFLADGFDGASMNKIVKQAGVSKGTLYAYFPSKEKLFESLIFEDRRRQAELALVIPDLKAELPGVLLNLGERLVRLFEAEESISYARMVIAVSGKLPEIGRAFYAAGPAYAIAHLGNYLEIKMQEGLLRKADPMLAATQFIDLLQAGVIKPKLFGMGETHPMTPTDRLVAAAVSLFLHGLAQDSTEPHTKHKAKDQPTVLSD